MSFSLSQKKKKKKTFMVCFYVFGSFFHIESNFHVIVLLGGHFKFEYLEISLYYSFE